MYQVHEFELIASKVVHADALCCCCYLISCVKLSTAVSACELDTSPDGNFHCFFNQKNQDFMKINKLTVAYSRLEYIRDHLCPSTLQETENIKVYMFT